MKLSESTAELFTAFSAFQGELDNASKSKQGHGYQYADLAECINTAKPFLAKYGLAVAQMLGMSPSGKQTMITILTHSSGQYMSSEFEMVEAVLQGGGGKNPAQTLGSAITYQRRYAYAAIIGLAQEDNDAAGMTRKQDNKQRAAFNQDDCLATFTQFASSADEQALKSSFAQAWKALNGTPQQSKAKEIYDIRLNEIKGE